MNRRSFFLACAAVLAAPCVSVAPAWWMRKLPGQPVEVNPEWRTAEYEMVFPHPVETCFCKQCAARRFEIYGSREPMNWEQHVWRRRGNRWVLYKTRRSAE